MAHHRTLDSVSPSRAAPAGFHAPSRRTVGDPRFATRAFGAVAGAGVLLAALTGCESMSSMGVFSTWDASHDTATVDRDAAVDAASAALHRGEPAEALVVLEPLLGPIGPDDAVAHELAGKAHLRMAAYEDASRHFRTARRSFAHPHDRRRAADLGAFADGLRAYANADFAGARAAWVEIDHPSLRRSAFDVLESRPDGVAITSLDGGRGTAEGDR